MEELFKQYVNNHSAQVNSEKRFVPRNCTVVDSNDYITRGNINYPTTKAEMDDKLIDILGGHFETGPNEDGSRWIDYLQDYTRVASQQIQFGVNLLDLKEVIKTDGVATRVIALGAKDETTEQRLTIASVNGGLDYVQDDAAVALFGVIEKVVIFDDVTDANNLLRKAKQELQSTINSTVSIELSASDLHNLDVDIQAFRVGDNVRVISAPHGLDRFFVLSKLHLELDRPSSCSMTLGAVFKSFTQKQVENQKKVNSTVQNAFFNVTELSNNIKSVENKVDNFIIEVPEEYVRSQDFEKYKVEVNQKLGSVYTIKGSIADFETLQALENMNIGDVYNLLSSGANYVYTDFGWDKLSENMDFSAYLTIADAEKKFATLTVLKTDYLSKTEIEDLLKGFYSKEDVNLLLEGYAKAENLSALEERVLSLENQINGGNE